MSVFTLASAQEGVQFEAVQISVNSPCNPVIFKGTKRSNYANTAFLMPRLQLAKTSRGTDAIEFLNLSSGKKILQMGLYFPKFSISNRTIRYENYSSAECNYQQILNAINHRVSSEDKINRIVTLQIKNILVEVDGVESVAKVASDKTSILNYEGQIKKVEIPITQDEGKDIVTRLTSNIGFNVNVHFEFLARSSNGHFEINISMKKLADEFKNQMNAQYQGIPLDKVKLSPMDLNLAVGSALASGKADMSGHVYSEDSTNEKFEEMAQKIVAQVTSNMVSGTLSDTGSGGEECASDDWECLQRQRLQTEGGQGPTLPEIPEGREFDGNGINAQVFYSRLKIQKNISLVMSNNSANSTETYTASMLIKKDDIENQRSQISLSSNGDVKNSRIKLDKGDEIVIYPHAEETSQINYEKQTTYYSVENLNDPSGFKHFPRLDKLTISKLEKNSTTGGDIASFEEKNTKWTRIPNTLTPMPIVTYRTYSWGEINYLPTSKKPVIKSYNEILDDESKVLENFKIGFVFNKKSPSKVYSLKQLMSNSGSFLDIEYDYNRYAFVIKANEDLGYIKLKNLSKTVMKSMKSKQHFQDTKTRVIFQSEKKAKTTRSFSEYDESEDLPVTINKQILKLEKVHPFENLNSTSTEFSVKVEEVK